MHLLKSYTYTIVDLIDYIVILFKATDRLNKMLLNITLNIINFEKYIPGLKPNRVFPISFILCPVRIFYLCHTCILLYRIVYRTSNLRDYNNEVAIKSQLMVPTNKD